MKKLKTIFFFNVLIILSILLIAEFVSKFIETRELCNMWKIQNPEMFSDKDIFKTLGYVQIQPFDYEKIVMSEVRGISQGTNANKRPVITIGDSYTYGSNLDKRQTFAEKISKYTGRTTYNRGVSGTGPQMVYRQLIDKDFKKQIPDAEYIIYVLLSEDSIYRQFLYSKCGLHYNKVIPKYVIKNNKLAEDNFLWYKLLFFSLGRRILVLKSKRDSYYEAMGNFPLFFKTMEECVNAVNMNYKNAKFVLLEMTHPLISDEDKEKNEPLNKKMIKRLEKMGIIYINAEELVGHDFNDVKKYRVADKDHPNELMWDEIVPKLSEKLNL